MVCRRCGKDHRGLICHPELVRRGVDFPSLVRLPAGAPRILGDVVGPEGAQLGLAADSILAAAGLRKDGRRKSTRRAKKKKKGVRVKKEKVVVSKEDIEAAKAKRVRRAAKALADTEARGRGRPKGEVPFDKAAYQREYKRKLRAAAKGEGEDGAGD